MELILTSCIFTILCIAIFIYSIWPKVNEEKGMLITHIDFKSGKTTLQPKRYKTWWILLMEWLPQSMVSGAIGILTGFILGWIKFS
jgi:hypothetical protein